MTLRERLIDWALNRLNGREYTSTDEYRLGRQAAKEVTLIHDLFDRLGINAAININAIVASDTGGFIRYPLLPGCRVSAITSIKADLETAISMHRGIEIAVNIRQPMLALEIPFPGERRPLFWSDANLDKLKPLQMLLGMDYTSDNPSPLVMDLNNGAIGHGLISGATRSGKTKLISLMINSICRTTGPDKILAIFIDPKWDENFTALTGLPHVLVVNEPDECAAMIGAVRAELNRRKRNPTHEKIVLIIDEYADLRGNLSKEAIAQLDADVTSIASIGASKHVHLFMATQKPVVEVVDTVAKGNLTTRIGGAVTTPEESRIAMGQPGVGCDALEGKGSFYVSVARGPIRRIQAYLLDGAELDQAVMETAQRWAGVEPYRIYVPEAGEGGEESHNPDQAYASKLLDALAYDQLFGEDGKPRPKVKTKAAKILFGPDAEMTGTQGRVVNRVFALIKEQVDV
jgi:DNA segregation ATPase FtsK/SpoIIIE-like protein